LESDFSWRDEQQLLGLLTFMELGAIQCINLNHAKIEFITLRRGNRNGDKGIKAGHTVDKSGPNNWRWPFLDESTPPGDAN
jgi:hypothetical protein